MTHPKGVPLLVVVDPPSCCYCKLNVPEGVITLGQRWGAHDGIMEPGCHCCVCCHRRIAAMITKNSIRYDAPIQNCPTKDNVRVCVDISVNFRIGTTEQDCYNFLYELSPPRFDELLEAETEEAIRNFVHSIKLSKINDVNVKHDLADLILKDLNESFNHYGVYFESAAIMSIRIPRQLREDLQNTTVYDVLLQNQIKKQQYEQLKLINHENQELQEVRRHNHRRLVEL